MGGKDDIVSQISMITDEKSHGLHHRRLFKKQAILEKKRESVSMSATVQQNNRYISSQGDTEIPDYINETKKTQIDRDKEADKRLWLYQIDQIEQEAMFKEQDLEQLHGVLKFKTQQHIKGRDRK